jgi:hypothetical protein
MFARGQLMLMAPRWATSDGDGQDDGAYPVHLRDNGNSRMKPAVCSVRHSSRNHEEVRTSSKGVWEIGLAGDALQTPGANAGGVALLDRV